MTGRQTAPTPTNTRCKKHGPTEPRYGTNMCKKQNWENKRTCLLSENDLSVSGKTQRVIRTSDMLFSTEREGRNVNVPYHPKTGQNIYDTSSRFKGDKHHMQMGVEKGLKLKWNTNL